MRVFWWFKVLVARFTARCYCMFRMFNSGSGVIALWSAQLHLTRSSWAQSPCVSVEKIHWVECHMAHPEFPTSPPLHPLLPFGSFGLENGPNHVKPPNKSHKHSLHPDSEQQVYEPISTQPGLDAKVLTRSCPV